MSNQTNFNLTYDCRNSDTRETLMNINISFENASDIEVKNKLNIWLKAIGLNLEVVEIDNKSDQIFLIEQ